MQESASTSIGLYETGIVTSAVEGMPVEALLGTSTRILHAPTVPVKLGHLHDPKTLLAVGGFILTTTLLARRVKGALLLGIVATATTGIFLGLGEAPKAIVAMPFR